MDRNRYSAIAHQSHTFYNPMNPSKIEKVIEILDLKDNDKVIDIGAGKGEILFRIIERYSAKCIAIEKYVGFTEQLQVNAENRGVLNNIEIITKDAKVAMKTMNELFEVAICIGSTHALGGLHETLDTLRKCVKKGGYVLIGEGYWKQQPSKEYLEALGGAEESELLSHFENVRAGEKLGLIPLWSYTVNEDEWDEYEWLYAMSIENYCCEHPDDPDRDAMLQKIRTWRSTYLKWGRDTLGFGIYLFRNM
ncbi:methyltransferase family protein [Cytobacillus firmus]|uniref:Methyltransferase family protein n=2 Tax=Cytobacillus TaxID=2675230 RepID=A0A366JJT8_CYTFI|nr:MULTISPECIES: methyltransferase domain-containing protein [Cytobacillus]RBP87620.1 methyltransferase family protein [Cytobacillus firmus]TDX39446.1 methyltransferase family protein [Cytobacillus oceanisediminis]